MPEVGEIKKGAEIGKKDFKAKHIWHPCLDCNKPSWVRLKRGNPVSLRCNSCANRRSQKTKIGTKSPGWKGGRFKNHHGYIEIKLYPGNPFWPMARNGYVLEHRLVMAQHLGRPLLKSEQVHHRPDVAKDDNRIEVLYLMPNPGAHSRLSPCSNCELKKEIRLLRWQIKNLIARLMGVSNEQ